MGFGARMPPQLCRQSFLLFWTQVWDYWVNIGYYKVKSGNLGLYRQNGKETGNYTSVSSISIRGASCSAQN